MQRESTDGLCAISHRVAGLAEEAARIQTDLREIGYAAYVPYQRFIESFAKSPADVEGHRTYVKEMAKGYLVPYDPENSCTYRSSFLEELRAASATSDLLRDPATAWIPQLHIDPCERNSMLVRVRNRKEYDRREQAMWEQRARQVELEVERHVLGLSKRPKLGMVLKNLRFSFAERVFQRELAVAGFEPTGRKSFKGAPILSKPIGDEWALIWFINETDLFYLSPKEGSLVPVLALQRTSREGIDQAYRIAFQSMIEGFTTAYLGFRDLAMLEVVIKAHAALYRLIGSDLERAIANC